MVKIRTLLTILLITLISSCSQIPSFLFGGGGPNVAANTQVGKENYQGVTTNIDRSVRPVLSPEGPVESIEQDNSTTNISEVDPLLLILLVLGWLAPSPSEIGRGILSIFRRKE